MSAAAAATPCPLVAAFKAQTRKRKFSAPFLENGDTWIIDCQGHQWCWVEGEWIRFTDDDDWFVLEVKAGRVRLTGDIRSPCLKKQ